MQTKKQMRKTIDLNLLNKIGNPHNLAERNLEQLMEKAETGFGSKANGLSVKILSLFIPREGTNIPVEETQVVLQLTKNNAHNQSDILGVLKNLCTSKILLPEKNGRYHLASNVLASQIYNKIEAENLVLRKVENFISERHSGYIENKHLLNEEDLNYISHYLPAISISKEEEAFIKRSRSNISRKRRVGFFIAAIVISALTILSIVAGFQYFRANKSLKEAERQKVLAITAEREAVLLAKRNELLAQTNKEEANKNAELASENEQLAITAQKKAKGNAILASKNEKLANENKEEAIKNADLAQKNQERAEENKKLANENEKLASKETKRAEENKRLADKANLEAQKNDNMRKIAFSQSLAKQAIQMDNESPEIKALVAREAFQINIKNTEGDILQPDIYSALYSGLKSLRASDGNDDFNLLSNERGSIRSIVFANDKPGDTFYTISSSGFLKKWKTTRWHSIDKPEVKPTVITHFNNPPNILKISADNKWMVVAGKQSDILLYDLKELNRNPKKTEPTRINAHGGQEVLTINFSPNNQTLISSGTDNTLQQYHLTDKTLRQIAIANAPIEAVAVSPIYPKFIYYSTTKGQFFEWKQGIGSQELAISRNNEKKRRISAIGISKIEGRKVLVIGHKNGKLKIFQSKPDDVFPVNRAGTIPHIVSELHSAQISAIEISPDRHYIAIGSYDGKASLWNIDRMVNQSYYQPMIFDGDASWVTSLSFTRRSSHLILGYRDGNILFFNPDPNVYANAICNTLNRSMSPEEWELYIGDALNLHYRQSCD